MIGGRKTQLLTTKIRPPRRPPGLIDRPRLFDLTAQARTKQVVLVKAGPGFGKTALALAFVEQLRQLGKPVAWLALDDEDDEPTRFLFYVSHALRRAVPGVGDAAIDLLSDISLVQFSAIVSTWINDLADVEEDVYLFLDDYHHITDHEIYDVVSYLLRYAPTQFRLVATATGEPSLPLGRLRAHNQLLEIDTESLRFDLDETSRFLDQENIRGLDVSLVRLLHSKSEGWPALLRIIAATLVQPGQDSEAYIRSLTGTLPTIGTFLTEMLNGLPREMVQFMVRISILDRFCAPLCKAITGADSSDHFLETMENSHLLLTPLDEERIWYRYHGLLADHLRLRLDAEFGNEVLRLHRRAYRWFATQTLWTEAVRHAIAAGDTNEAIGWIEQCAMDLVKRGDLLTLLSWQRQFPTELEESQIKVETAIAWGLALAMRFDEAVALVAKIERGLSLEAQGGNAAVWECQAIRAVVLALQDDSQAALAIAEACVKNATDPWTVNVSSNVALFGYWKAGDFQSFFSTPWIPYSDEDDKRNVFAWVYRRCLEGLIEFQHLRLSTAERCYLDATQVAERHAGRNTAAAALPASLLARIRYEQGRANEAEEMILDRLAIVDAVGWLESVLSTRLVLIDIAAQHRDLDRAFALIEALESLGQTRRWARAVAAALLAKMRLCLAEGRMVESRACLSRLERLESENPSPKPSAWTDLRTYRSAGKALLCLAENRTSEAIAILRTLRQEAEEGSDWRRALRFSTMLAEALLADDERAESERLFSEILRIAAPTGLYQSILDDGPDIGPLLRAFQAGPQRGVASPELTSYAERLLSGWKERYRPEIASDALSDPVEGLSPRERNILQRIGRGGSNKDIARELGIAPETVKSHVKNIFIKLGVDNRAHAVSRALSLGLARD
jgi:LuxR family maltose regulon positive regulatory protein